MNDELPDITEGITDAEAEASGTFDLTIDEVRSNSRYLDAIDENARLRRELKRLREQLAAEMAIARDLLQRNVELGTRADNAEAACEDLREQLAAANDTTPSTAAAWEVDAYATRYTAYSTGAADDAPGWPPVDAMHTVVAELAAANARAQTAERERDDARIETAHANERARLDGAMANAWVEHCDTLDAIDRNPGRTGCEPGCDRPHHEQLRQALAEITRLTNQVDAARVLRNATESMYGVFKKIAATRRTDRDQARAETAELRARLDALGELREEWGVSVEDSSGAVVADDERAARRDAARYSRYHRPGGEPAAYHVVTRLVGEWREAPDDGADITAALNQQETIDGQR